MKQIFCLTVLMFLSIPCSRGQENNPSSNSSLTVRSNIAATKVFDDSLFLGTTPLDSVPVKPGIHILRYVPANERSWFASPIMDTVSISSADRVLRTADFPILNPSIDRSSVSKSSSISVQSTNNFSIYASTATAVVSGVLAAYFKMKADNNYGEYRLSANSGLLDNIHRYDTASGVALGVSELSLAWLAYTLLSR